MSDSKTFFHDRIWFQLLVLLSAGITGMSYSVKLYFYLVFPGARMEEKEPT